MPPLLLPEVNDPQTGAPTSSQDEAPDSESDGGCSGSLDDSPPLTPLSPIQTDFMADYLANKQSKILRQALLHQTRQLTKQQQQDKYCQMIGGVEKSTRSNLHKDG